jgi:CubicO group peptidase (beta-lactamase class C family)
LAGVGAMIASNGKIVYERAFGFADREAGRRMEAGSICRIFSLSKPITSVAVLMLLEEGRLGLMDPVADHLPELRDVQVYDHGPYEAPVLTAPARRVTIADLLTHTGGLTYGQAYDHPVDRMYQRARLFRREGTIADMVGRLARLPLKHQPGSRWEYSISHDVLGRVVEVVSGDRFDRFLHDRVFEPLGMVDTGFSVPDHKLDRFATMYRPSPERGIEVDDPAGTSRWLDPVTFFAGGEGLVSTMPDCLRFLQMLLNKGDVGGTRLLGRKTVDLMTMNHLPEPLLKDMFVPGYGFGLGVGVLVDLAAQANPGSPGEYGWAGSGSTFFWVDPVENLISILFAQFMPSSEYTIAREFKALMYQALL